MAGWLSQPLDRVRDLIEGTYPVTPVVGRTVPAATFKATRLHGDLESPEFPGAHYHRGFDLVVDRSGGIGANPPNVHAGRMIRRAILSLRIGYLYGRDAASRAAGAGTALWSPTLTGHEDHELIEQALRYPAHWGGLTPEIVRLAPLDDATTRVVIPHQRILVTRLWEIQVSYQPGRTWS